MATQAQINANRQNAKKSTGPQTPEGKAVASQNAIKHGLSAKYDVISSESQADFDLHRQRILDDLAPVGQIESMLAERIVSLSWRLERSVRIQNQVIDAMIEKDDNSSPLTTLTQSTNTQDLTLGRVAIYDFTNYRVLDRLMMYERRIENSLYKTMLELQRHRLARKTDTHTSTDKQIEESDHQIPEAQDSDKNLQNEPNHSQATTNSNSDFTKDYESMSASNHPENKPNSIART